MLLVYYHDGSCQHDGSISWVVDQFEKGDPQRGVLDSSAFAYYVVDAKAFPIHSRTVRFRWRTD